VGRTVTAFKGHGTENDFIVLPDLDAVLSLSPSLVAALCDRHAGVGADGVLRVVRTAHATEPDVLAQAREAEFFMDYHNADGSIAEMCGNGVRVFVRYLEQAGLANDNPVRIATRGGVKTVTIGSDELMVEMGRPVIRRERPEVVAPGIGAVASCTAIDMPNPHVVVILDDERTLDSLDLSSPPVVSPPLPEGQNVEFAVRTGPRSIRMRVHERGVGETRSCGTGICAVAAAVAGEDEQGEPWQIVVPGGTTEVCWDQNGTVFLSGPAVLVARLEIGAEWMEGHR
jgi:diaminopimelate epimerase